MPDSDYRYLAWAMPAIGTDALRIEDEDADVFGAGRDRQWGEFISLSEHVLRTVEGCAAHSNPERCDSWMWSR